MSHTCPIVVSHVSDTCLIVVSSPSARRRECQESAECIRLHSGQTRCPRGLWRFSAVCCRTKENNSARGKPQKIKEITAPGGCVVCGGFKGPAAALAAGALRAPVSVRGTLTKSAGRPRRRSRWERPPHTKPVRTSKQKAALGRPFALADGLLGQCAAAVEAKGRTGGCSCCSACHKS